MKPRGMAVAVAMAAFLSAIGPAGAGSLDQRLGAVSGTIEAASEMFNAAKKGHMPSLEAINNLQARIDLSRSLFDQAAADAKAGRTRTAEAKLDAAEFLAHKVFEAAEH